MPVSLGLFLIERVTARNTTRKLSEVRGQRSEVRGQRSVPPPAFGCGGQAGESKHSRH